MHDFAPFIAPALAMFLILRRGFTARRVRPGQLWTFPVLITVLATAALSQGKAPDLEALAIFAVALAAGAALGWFTTQHVELTLDEKSGTIMSQATPFGTLLTAAVFAGRFAIQYYLQGAPGTPVPVHHADGLLRLADAGLLFVAARGLAQAWHMWIRTRPLIARHKAAQQAAPPPPP